MPYCVRSVPRTGGYKITMYTNPEPARQLSSNEPWTLERAADAMEDSFRPLAESGTMYIWRNGGKLVTM